MIEGEDVTRVRKRLAWYFKVSQISPVVRGTWFTVNHVINLIVDGLSWSDILTCHSELTEEDIRACITFYWANVTQRKLLALSEILDESDNVGSDQDPSSELENLKSIISSIVGCLEGQIIAECPFCTGLPSSTHQYKISQIIHIKNCPYFLAKSALGFSIR